MIGWMVELMDGWEGGWIDGWIDGWMDAPFFISACERLLSVICPPADCVSGIRRRPPDKLTLSVALALQRCFLSQPRQFWLNPNTACAASVSGGCRVQLDVCVANEPAAPMSASWKRSRILWEFLFSFPPAKKRERTTMRGETHVKHQLRSRLWNVANR